MKPIVLRAKYEGPCLFCGRLVKVGKEIVWEEGIGIAHAQHFSSKELKKDGLLAKIKARDEEEGR